MTREEQRGLRQWRTFGVLYPSAPLCTPDSTPLQHNFVYTHLFCAAAAAGLAAGAPLTAFLAITARELRLLLL